MLRPTPSAGRLTQLRGLLAAIAQVKGNLVRTMTIEGQSVVPIENVQRMTGTFIDLCKKYVPVDQKSAFLEDLRVATRYDEPLAP